jgi:hypothetical protein
VAFVPDGLELEAFHHQGEIDLQFVGPGGSCQRTARHYLFGQPAIAGAVERFVCEPQLQASVIAGGPSLNQVVGV